MPIPGTGVVPPIGGVYNELANVNRRAFVPRVYVQMYFASPTLFYLWGNAQRAAGGLSQVTVPMQGNSMVQGQYTGYGGGFNSPQVTPGVQNGQWNLAYWVVPVPLPFGETIIQATEREVSLLKLRMNDVFAVTRQRVAKDLFSLPGGNPLFPDSLLTAFDNGTNVTAYGGINRSLASNANYRGQYINAGAGSTWNTQFQTATNGWNRKAMSSLLMYITTQAGSEAPTFVVMNPGDFATLNNDFIGTEEAFVRPGSQFTIDTPIRSSFPNLNVAGIPIFADYFVPVNNLIACNCKYTGIYLSEDAALDFSGFQSLVALGQIGQQGVCVLGWDTISAKSVSGAWVYGFGGNVF